MNRTLFALSMLVVMFSANFAYSQGGGEKIYWTDPGGNAVLIKRANLDGTGIEDLVDSGLSAPYGIALDLAGGKMYWTDWVTDKIQRANLDGSNVEDLVTSGLNRPQDIALDLAGGKMYWAEPSNAAGSTIRRANLTGSNVEDLITSGLGYPSGISLDVSSGKLYWADAANGRIQRANLDGTGVENLVNADLGNDSGIALDAVGGKIYWAGNKIQRANLNGTNVEDLVTFGPGDTAGSLSLDVSGGKMYWIPPGILSPAREIVRANLNGTNIEDVITMINPIRIALAVDLPPTNIDVSPSSLDFTLQAIGGGPSEGMVVTITNTGTGNLTFVGSEVAVTGTNPGEFTIASDSGQNPLGPGASRNVTVTFDPSSLGDKTANLVITTNDGGRPTINVPLSGTGIETSGVDEWDLYE